MVTDPIHSHINLVLQEKSHLMYGCVNIFCSITINSFSWVYLISLFGKQCRCVP